MANPSFGLRLKSPNGAFCPSTTGGARYLWRRSSLTVDIFCVSEATEPVLKDWALKNNCDLHVSLQASFGCPVLEHAQPPPTAQPPPNPPIDKAYPSLEGRPSPPPRGAATSVVSHHTGHAPHLCTCPLSLLQNDVCDTRCDTPGCFADNGACKRHEVLPQLALAEANATGNASRNTSLPSCAPSCPSHWLSDGECDLRCNVAACEWDGGDCHRPACVFEPSDGVYYDMSGFGQHSVLIPAATVGHVTLALCHPMDTQPSAALAFLPPRACDRLGPDVAGMMWQRGGDSCHGLGLRSTAQSTPLVDQSGVQLTFTMWQSASTIGDGELCSTHPRRYNELHVSILCAPMEPTAQLVSWHHEPCQSTTAFLQSACHPSF